MRWILDFPQAMRSICENGVDSAPEERFDRLTRMARRMFGVPISLVSIVDSDRQWFKSRQGLDATETARAVSFCGHAILGDGVFTVEDATADERFRDNPLVAGDPNDRFGHAEGDRALVAFSNIMRDVFRDSDVYARTGGDELVVLLTDTDETGAKESMQRFRDALSEYNRRESRGYGLEYSAGYVTRSADDERGVEALIEAADDMMYARKKRKTRGDDQSS